VPENSKKAKDAEQAKPKRCDRCLGLQPCLCLPLDMEEYDISPDKVVWVASRSVDLSSPVKEEKKHKYAKACREVERLNRFYAGKVQYFLLPVTGHGRG